MSFTALSDRIAIRAAFNQFKDGLCRGIKPVTRNVGFQGGNFKKRVYWLAAEGFWCVMEPEWAYGRTWCAFGLDDPHDWDNLSIICEINSPHKGVDRRVAGAFVSDAKGELSVAHSGKIGGGRKGIGQTAFLRHYRGASVPVTFADGLTAEMLMIGALRSRKLRAEIGHFVREVSRVKQLLVTSGTKAGQTSHSKGDKFTPEFSGKKRRFNLSGSVEAVATHGLVVQGLVDALSRLDLAANNDRNRDLYLGPHASPTHIFEVKTDSNPYSIYTGVGQLLIHGGSTSAKIRRVLLLPDPPSAAMATRLKSLGVRLLIYRWRDSKPVLKGLGQVL